MNKIPKKALNLKQVTQNLLQKKSSRNSFKLNFQFMLRQQVLKLYREIFRTIKLVPSESSRHELKEWARSDFRSNMHHTDEITIKMVMQHGNRSLTELKTSLGLSGIKN